MNITIKTKKYIIAFCKGIFVIQLKFIFSFLIKKLESMADPEGFEPSTSTSVVPRSIEGVIITSEITQ